MLRRTESPRRHHFCLLHGVHGHRLLLPYDAAD
jgi:hypothetical protein